MNMEAIDGNAIFSIPRAQVAEVLFDGCWYFANRYPTKVATLRFMCTSRTLLEQYAKVFTKRYEKLMQDQEEAGPHSEENPPSNFMLDTYQDDFEWIKLYGMHQKQLYNDCGTAVNIDLYDAFTACERRFGRPKSPVLLAQVKSYLRDVQNATDMQLNAIIQRRQKECQKNVIEAFEKHKANHVEFFRHLCVYNLQFCKEILIKTIKEIASLDNLFLPPSQLSKMLQRYAGEEESAAEDENGGASAPGSPSQQRAGAQRTASEIFIAKNKTGKRRSSGRPVKRRSARPNGANNGGSTTGMSPSPSSESIPTPTGTLRNGGGFDDIELDPYQNARDRIGKDAVANWTHVMDVLYSSNLKVTNMAFDVTQTADADKLAAALVRVFYYNDDALTLLRLAIKSEVDKTAVLSTLFRQNSMASKMLTTFSRLVSKEYLIKILSPCIQQVVEAGDSLEVDPSKLKGDNIDLKANQEKLKEVTETLIADICKSVELLPPACRSICAILKEVVEPKFPDGANVAIAGFLVLRLINPVLVVPDADGISILSKEKTAEVRRGLLLVSKLIQNLANQVDFKKEEFMITFNSFLSEKFALMEDFFLECASSADNGDVPPPPEPIVPEITSTVFNESLRVVSNIFILSKDKYLPLLEMDGETLDEFKALVHNPIDPATGSSASVVTTQPISLKDANSTEPALSKKESSMFNKKDKEKEKEKDKKEKEKEKERKAEKEKEKAEKEKEKAEKEHKKEEKKAEKEKKKDKPEDEKKDKKEKKK